VAETSSFDHGCYRFRCVLSLLLVYPFSKCCPTSTDISWRCKGRSSQLQTAGMKLGVLYGHCDEGCSSVHLTHTDSTIRIPRGFHHTDSQNSIPAKCTFLFQHALPDHSCFVACATKDTNGPACNVTSSSPDSKHVGMRSLSHLCHRTCFRRWERITITIAATAGIFRFTDVTRRTAKVHLRPKSAQHYI
jgi:hypothetical protein